MTKFVKFSYKFAVGKVTKAIMLISKHYGSGGIECLKVHCYQKVLPVVSCFRQISLCIIVKVTLRYIQAIVSLQNMTLETFDFEGKKPLQRVQLHNESP